jgi:hypothetical protein
VWVALWVANKLFVAASEQEIKNANRGKSEQAGHSNIESELTVGVGFVLKAVFWIPQVAENNMPPLPRMPPLARRIARYCPLASDRYGFPLLPIKTKVKKIERSSCFRSAFSVARESSQQKRTTRACPCVR